ncbi:MAG: hypothetical protein KDC15_03360 [Chitinophagaceae bacterium]|nr:hypothetical protein [Chitinophagaceae bacterium]
MKILFTIILLLSGATALRAQFFYYPIPPAMADYTPNKKAHVKKCYEYKLRGNEKALSRMLEYGNGGLPTALYETGLRYNGDTGTVITGSNNKYKDGKLIENNMVYHYQSDAGYTIVYTYDDSGRLYGKMVTDTDTAIYTYVYDKSGKIIRAEISLKTPDSKANTKALPDGRCEYSYNAKDMLVQETSYTKDDEKQFTYQWEYNSEGQIIKVTGTSAEEQVFYECLMEYGKNNLLSKRTENIPGEETGIYVYEYCTDCRQSLMNNNKNDR